MTTFSATVRCGVCENSGVNLELLTAEISCLGCPLIDKTDTHCFAEKIRWKYSLQVRFSFQNTRTVFIKDLLSIYCRNVVVTQKCLSMVSKVRSVSRR